MLREPGESVRMMDVAARNAEGGRVAHEKSRTRHARIVRFAGRSLG